uniref:C-X-C motif chemokine n=1 Tax=Astyanax mexicanus TaxID=7994 RepID=A0A3B1JCY1_ASTMX
MMLLSVSVHSSGMKSDANGGNSEKGEQQSDHLPSEKTTLQFHNVTVDQPPSFIPQLVNSQQDKNEPFLTRTTFGPQVILSKTSDVTVDQPPSFIPLLVNSQLDKNEPFLTRTTFGPQVLSSKISDVTVDQPPSFIPLLVNSQLDKNEPFLTRTTFGPQVLSSKISGQKTSVKRCLCLGPRLNIVRLQRVEKIEVFPASPLCDTLEIIVTLKNIGGKRCLNPESKFAQNYIKKSVEERSTQ